MLLVYQKRGKIITNKMNILLCNSKIPKVYYSNKSLHQEEHTKEIIPLRVYFRK